MRSIYITGIAGLIGSNLAKFLLKKEYKVGGCDSLSGGYEDNIPIDNWDKLDILDTSSLSKAIEGYDSIIHCAALAYEGLSVFSPKLITESIYTGTISVASAAIANNIELLINCSSMARYGDIKPPFKETDTPNPVDPYGLAKLQAEQALNLLSKIHSIKVIHTIPHNVVGIGQKYNDPFRNVISIFTNKLLRSNSIIIYGDGKQIRSFSHIDSCVDAIYKIINKPELTSGELFNIGPMGNEVSIIEVANKVAHYCQVFPIIQHLPDRPCEVKNAYCSSEKAIKELSYDPNIKNIDEIIQELVAWIKSRKTLPFDYTFDLEIINENTPKTWTDRLI